MKVRTIDTAYSHFQAEVGTAVHLGIDGFDGRLKSSLEGILPDEYLILKLPQLDTYVGQPRHFELESEILVRYVHRGAVWGFRSRVRRVISTPVGLLVIDIPDRIESYDLRQEERVDCLLPGKIQLEKRSKNGAVVDLSQNGCRPWTITTICQPDTGPSADTRVFYVVVRWQRLYTLGTEMKKSLTEGIICLAFITSVGVAMVQGLSHTVDEWERGFLISPQDHPEMRMFVWFYEWHMFDAVLPGIHTHGPNDWSDFRRRLGKDHNEGAMEEAGIRLEIKGVQDGADLLLTIKNSSKHDWSEIAAIIPCFNPGPNPKGHPGTNVRWNATFVDADKTHTWFVSPDGISLLEDRSIHFNQALHRQVEQVRADKGSFAFDGKWPTSPTDAKEGLIMRESLDGGWVAGIAWERFLSSQGHNPWFCMHLSVKVGPLKKAEIRQIRGKMYLFRGTKEDCYKKYLSDFKNSEADVSSGAINNRQNRS